MCWGDTHTKTWGSSSANPGAVAPFQGCDCGVLSPEDFELVPSLNKTIDTLRARLATLEAALAAADSMAGEDEPDELDEACRRVWCHFCGSEDEDWIGPEGHQQQVRKHRDTCVWQAYRAARARCDEGEEAT